MADLPRPVWVYKFRLDSGKWVFVPDPATKEFGRELKKKVESRWRPPRYFVHLGNQGHVRALRSHHRSRYYARIDIKSFFNSITKSRVTRHLNGVFGDYDEARIAAAMSTVPNQEATQEKPSYVLPFGFVQSPILAALCLHHSKLGTALGKLPKTIKRCVYVDDILISTSGAIGKLTEAYDRLVAAIAASGFQVNEQKLSPPAEMTTVFNINIAKEHLEVSQQRLDEFRAVLAASQDARVVNGVLGYVRSVNAVQADELTAAWTTSKSA